MTGLKPCPFCGGHEIGIDSYKNSGLLMTNEEAKIYLRNWRNAIESCVDTDFSDVIQSLNIAISALESIDRIKAERDAAVRDLSKAVSRMGGDCRLCKRNRTCIKEDKPCKWEWKGVTNGAL